MRGKKWYDGFTFGSQRDVYNPWSIINYLKLKEFKPYWANTSSNSLVSKLIQEGTAEIKMNMETLLEQGQIETRSEERRVGKECL